MQGSYERGNKPFDSIVGCPKNIHWKIFVERDEVPCWKFLGQYGTCQWCNHLWFVVISNAGRLLNYDEEWDYKSDMLLIE